jgi:pimeloyl-ACP methyl ester carboxylesterase
MRDAGTAFMHHVRVEPAEREISGSSWPGPEEHLQLVFGAPTRRGRTRPLGSAVQRLTPRLSREGGDAADGVADAKKILPSCLSIPASTAVTGACRCGNIGSGCRGNSIMIARDTITIQPGLTFDTLSGGEKSAPLVLLLHGFAESMHCWRAQISALAGNGYRAIAPSQRGYSPGARPDVAEPANYHIDRLMDDAMAIVGAAGYGETRFHLAGHDWGGSIAWSLADRYPQRIASLAVLSRPHPNAFNRALQMPDGEQAKRSKHHKAFLESDAADVVLANDSRWLRDRLTANGVPKEAIERHLSVLGNKGAMEGALAWYRARGAIRGPLGPIRIPTLYIWGDADDTVGRVAAEGAVDFVAAPYRFEVLPGVGHFAADQMPDRVSELLLQHVAAHPA